MIQYHRHQVALQILAAAHPMQARVHESLESWYVMTTYINGAISRFRSGPFHLSTYGGAVVHSEFGLSPIKPRGETCLNASLNPSCAHEN